MTSRGRRRRTGAGLLLVALLLLGQLAVPHRPPHPSGPLRIAAATAHPHATPLPTPAAVAPLTVAVPPSAVPAAVPAARRVPPVAPAMPVGARDPPRYQV